MKKWQIIYHYLTKLKKLFNILAKKSRAHTRDFFYFTSLMPLRKIHFTKIFSPLWVFIA